MGSDGVREIVLAKDIGLFCEEKIQHRQSIQIHLARKEWIRDDVGSTGQSERVSCGPARYLVECCVGV